MKVPDTVKVGGEEYSVSYQDVVSDDPNIYGICIFHRNEIQLSNYLENDALKVTFIHELLHAVFSHTNIEQNEDVIERLANALYMVIRDNPEIFSE